MDEKADNGVLGWRVRAGKRLDSRTVPEAVRSRFVQVGRTYQFEDGATAFVDHGTRLSTRSENTEVVRSLVEIAAARDWRRIRVSGTEVFRREAWRQARERGLEVSGYAPSEYEEERIRRRREFSAGMGRAEGVREGSEAPPSASTDATLRDLPLPDPRNPNAPPLFRGTLVGFGAAPFAFNKANQPSFYVRISTADGPRILWGADFERAITQSTTQPQVGDEVGIHPIGRSKVTVREGDVAKTTHKNRWVIEKPAFFLRRAEAAATLRKGTAAPADVVSRDPVLRDAYLALKVAELVAEKKVDMSADRLRFVAAVRERLATMLEIGQTVPAVPLKERTERVGPEDGQRADRRERVMELDR